MLVQRRSRRVLHDQRRHGSELLLQLRVGCLLLPAHLVHLRLVARVQRAASLHVLVRRVGEGENLYTLLHIFSFFWKDA